MSAFADAFKEGIATAESQRLQHDEIVSVFDQFATQIEEASDGKVLIEKGLDGVIYANHSGHLKRKAICTCRSKPPQNIGYPITIEYFYVSVTCASRQELESALVDMLRHSAVGLKMLTLSGGASSR